MRPPLNAGENRPVLGALRLGKASFNEAPAERGGKRPANRACACRPWCFNEAPAERGGKRRGLPEGLASAELLQ